MSMTIDHQNQAFTNTCSRLRQKFILQLKKLKMQLFSKKAAQFMSF